MVRLLKDVAMHGTQEVCERRQLAKDTVQDIEKHVWESSNIGDDLEEESSTDSLSR